MHHWREREAGIDRHGLGKGEGCGMKIGHLNGVRGGEGGTDEMWV